MHAASDALLAIGLAELRRTGDAVEGIAAMQQAYRNMNRGDGPEGSDTKAYYQGMITVVPIRLDWTDAASLARLREWKLTVQ